MMRGAPPPIPAAPLDTELMIGGQRGALGKAVEDDLEVEKGQLQVGEG